jgi:predicted PP-loop superfamily ATPase
MKVIVAVKPGVDATAVSEKLKTAGMTVTSVMPLSGVIAGEVDDINKIKTVDGVLAVEPEQTCHTS